MFWILNKHTNAPAVCGSVVAVAELTAINHHTLYRCFSREKKVELNTENYRVCKVEMSRSESVAAKKRKE